MAAPSRAQQGATHGVLARLPFRQTTQSTQVDPLALGYPQLLVLRQIKGYPIRPVYVHMRFTARPAAFR